MTTIGKHISHIYKINLFVIGYEPSQEILFCGT
jgi:hypothetical protein